MLIFRSGFICFLMTVTTVGSIGQALPVLNLPEGSHGTVTLNISNLQTQERALSDSEIMVVFVENDKDQYVSNAIQGHYTKDGEYLIFKPHFPFEEGISYIVKTIRDKSNDDYTYRTFQIGKKDILAQAKITSIYPTADQLPENLLRFYMYFNTPMKKGQALKHIKLINEDGGIDNHAFMEFKQELWSADGKRLTLLFDPGRIKRGVSTHVLRGPALIEGKKYKLSLSGDWQDVHGQQLMVNTTKEFVVGHKYRQRIQVSNWALDIPKAHTNGPLIIAFDRIMDHALLESMIRIEDEKNKELSGYWEVLENERSMRFIPENQWKEGNYYIRMDSRLEDIAGNNLQNLLDYLSTEEGNGETYQYIRFKI